MAAIEGRICDTLKCEKPAKLQCPTCIKLGIPGSFFCEQVIIFYSISQTFILTYTC